MSRVKEYAIYKGDEFITLGTAEELSKELNVRPETIHWMSTNACKKRNNSGNRLESFVIESDNELND